MIAGSVRKISLVALLVMGATLLAPAGAQAAAPQLYCIVAYGHENPGNCDPQPELNAAPYEGRIYPMSQPYGYGERGLLFVEGVTEANAAVSVSVTDGTDTYYRSVNATGAGEFKADIKVTNLGVHASTPSNVNGISELTVTVLASVASVNSAPKTTTIDKYAIAPGDQGTTGKDKYAPFFPAIIRGTTTYPNPEYPGMIGHSDIWYFSEGVIRGLVEDDSANTFGHSSEIASINVVISQDGLTIRDYGNVANRINSTQAKFDIVISGKDFEPNCTYVLCTGPSYDVTIEVKDANGNKVTATGTFDVNVL